MKRPWQGREGCKARQPTMKSRVEASNLRKVRPGVANGHDAGQVVRLVQWGKRNKLPQALLHRDGHHDRAIALGPTVDDPVPHRHKPRSRGMPVNRFQQLSNRNLVVRNVTGLVDYCPTLASTI